MEDREAGGVRKSKMVMEVARVLSLHVFPALMQQWRIVERAMLGDPKRLLK